MVGELAWWRRWLVVELMVEGSETLGRIRAEELRVLVGGDEELLQELADMGKDG